MNTRRPLLTPLSRLAPALLLPFALSGCGGGGSNGATSTAPAPTPAPVLSASAVTPSGLTATLAEDRATVAVGGSVTYTLTLTNNTNQAITVQFVDSPCAFFGALGTGGVVVLSDPAGKPVTQGGTCTIAGRTVNITLAPAQTASGTVGSGTLNSAGKYSAVGSFFLQALSASTPQQTDVGPLIVTAQ